MYLQDRLIYKFHLDLHNYKKLKETLVILKISYRYRHQIRIEMER